MFDNILIDLIFSILIVSVIIAGFCFLFYVDSNTFYNVTVYYLDGTVETFVAVNKLSTNCFKLKDGTYYHLPDGVRFKYDIVKKSDKGLNIKKDKE